MKKLTILAVCLLTFFACGKKNSTPPPINTPVIGSNVVTVNTGGKSYTIYGDAPSKAVSLNQYIVEVSTYQTQGQDAFILLRVVNGSNTLNEPDITFHLESLKGNSNGVGTYQLKHYNEYFENFAGGDTCAGTFSGSITVTKNDIGKLTEGTFTITLGDCNYGKGNGKVITGSFKATSF